MGGLAFAAVELGALVQLRSEKEEAFSFAGLGGGRGIRDIRQRATIEGRAWIFNEKRTSALFAELPGDLVKGEFEFQWTPRGVVGVAGHEMHPALGNPKPGQLLCNGAKNAGEGAGGDLNEVALQNPVSKTLRMRAEDSVSFRMGDHGMETGELQFVKGLIHRGRNGKFVKFH
jgi:hypothetical protein